MTIFQENFGFKKDLGGANRHRGRGFGIQKKPITPLIITLMLVYIPIKYRVKYRGSLSYRFLVQKKLRVAQIK